MECWECGSFSHNTLDHKESQSCDHGVVASEEYLKHGKCKRCLLCGKIFKYVDNKLIVVGFSYQGGCSLL